MLHGEPYNHGDDNRSFAVAIVEVGRVTVFKIKLTDEHLHRDRRRSEKWG